ncbi:hypothetical protein VTK26DRAFT_5454 [Humicola hyalothermophila]
MYLPLMCPCFLVGGWERGYVFSSHGTFRPLMGIQMSAGKAWEKESRWLDIRERAVNPRTIYLAKLKYSAVVCCGINIASVGGVSQAMCVPGMRLKAGRINYPIPVAEFTVCPPIAQTLSCYHAMYADELKRARGGMRQGYGMIYDAGILDSCS